MDGPVCPLDAPDGLCSAAMKERFVWQGRTVELYGLGDGAVTLRVGHSAEESVNRRLSVYTDVLEREKLPGFLEAAPGYHTATVYYDPSALYRSLERLPAFLTEGAGSLQEVVAAWMKSVWLGLEAGQPPSGVSRLVELPVRYGGADGPDLEEAAALCGLSAEEYVRLHSSAEYRVYMIGFVPGFPYLGGMPQELAVPRLAAPRLTVPAGSVAVGGSQTGIYPQAVPGGWRLIGRTPLELFRPDREEPSLLRAGDRVRFVPAEGGIGPWKGR